MGARVHRQVDARLDHLQQIEADVVAQALVGVERDGPKRQLCAQAARVMLDRLRLAKRTHLMPEVPTVAETGMGLEGFEVLGWFALLAPAKTPTSIIQLLNAELN